MIKSEFQRTAGSAGLIGLTAFIGALIGFVLQLLVAYYFGADQETDAFFMAQSTSELLGKLLMGGSITAVFIPLFVERLTRGERSQAWQLALNIFHLMGAAYLVLIILLAFFAEPFVAFIAPGFSGEAFALTVALLRVLLPAFFFLFLVELATSVLHSFKQFTLPALLRLVAPSVSIVSIILFVQSLGIYALALGVVVGSVIQFGILAWGLRREHLGYQFVFQPRDPAIKRLIKLVYPFIFSVLVTQLAGVVYRVLVSRLEPGSLASLKFGEKITQLVTIMFLNSVTLVIYPLLSEKASRRDYDGMKETIGSSVRLIFFVTLPLVTGIVLLRDPLIQVLYQRGSFTAEDAAMTSIALLFLIIGLTTNGISSVLGHAVLALQKTRAAVAVTVCSQAVAIALFLLLVPALAHAGLALASSLVPLSSGLLYFLYLTRFMPRLHTIFWHATYAKTILLTGAMALVILAMSRLVPGVLLVLMASTVAGIGVFFGGAYWWRVPEMKDVVGILQGKVNKWRAKDD